MLGCLHRVGAGRAWHRASPGSAPRVPRRLWPTSRTSLSRGVFLSLSAASLAAVSGAAQGEGDDCSGGISPLLCRPLSGPLPQLPRPPGLFLPSVWPQTTAGAWIWSTCPGVSPEHGLLALPLGCCFLSGPHLPLLCDGDTESHPKYCEDYINKHTNDLQTWDVLSKWVPL